MGAETSTQAKEKYGGCADLVTVLGQYTTQFLQIETFADVAPLQLRELKQKHSLLQIRDILQDGNTDSHCFDQSERTRWWKFIESVVNQINPRLLPTSVTQLDVKLLPQKVMFDPKASHMDRDGSGCRAGIIQLPLRGW